VAAHWRAAGRARKEADKAEDRRQIEQEIQREVARRLAKAEEREKAKKKTRVGVQEVVRRMDEIARARAPNITQSTPTSPGPQRRIGRLVIHGGEPGVNGTPQRATSPIDERTRDVPPTEREVRKVLEKWGMPFGRLQGSKSARGSFANLSASREDDIPALADYARDLPQFAEEWGIKLTSRAKHDLTQQLQRTVKRIQQELKRMNEELQGTKNAVRMKRAAGALEKFRENMRDTCDDIGRLDEDCMIDLEQDIEEALVSYETVETTESARGSAASSGSANAGLVKLPRINIVQFHGKPQEYVTWAAQVKAHVLEQDLAPVAKFVYLERSAQGDVKTLVKRYQATPTEESLEKCLEDIRSRYGNPKLRLRAALDRFQRKENRPGYKESRRLLDSARASLTEILDMPQFKDKECESMRFCLTLRVQDLVPADVLTKWTSEKGDDLSADLEGFLDFADHIINAQIGQVSMDAKAAAKDKDKDKDKERGRGNATASRGASGGAGTSTALHAQTTSKEGDDKATGGDNSARKKKFYCIFCAKEDLDHHMATCPKAKKAHPNERNKKFDAHEGRKSEICLHAGHNTNKCFQKRRRNDDSLPFCSKCTGEHHVFLHASSS